MKPEMSWSATAERIGIKKGLFWVVFSTILIIILIFISAWQLTGYNHKVWANTNWLKLGGGWLLMCSALWALGHRWRAH